MMSENQVNREAVEDVVKYAESEAESGSEQLINRVVAAVKDPDSKLAKAVHLLGESAVLFIAGAVVSNSIGECRRELPYSPMHPEMDDQGNWQWCCNHNPAHCR